MPTDRPDPDQLLAQVQAEEAQARRGRLRIFFGASAGVGKTYAMLEAALAAKAAGSDVVVGYVEPHGRRETERLLETLECVATQPVTYRGRVRQEFDLDASLRRRPEILLVDELAHSNLVEGEPPPRHAKRWQDIAELCDAGINVWTTLNIQHLESLNDLIAQITGIRQRETIPDKVLDEADEIELIDLPPDDLLQRLQQGKIYLPEQAAAAVERFFRKPNLIALRELALRRTADRVDAAARAQGPPGSQSRAYLARDRILVAIGPDTQAEQLVRTGKRIADALDAEWTTVYVETPALQRLSAAERDRRIEILRMAESLGAGTVTLDGPTAAAALLEYARTRGATRVLVGEPKRRGWRALVRPSTATELVKRTQGFDVLVVSRQDETTPRRVRPHLELARDVHWSRYGWAAAITVACTVIAYLMNPTFTETNVAMIYVLGATIAGLRLGRGPGTLTAISGVAAFDFFFVPPRYTFQVSDAQYIVTFLVMLAVTLTIGNLMANVRQQNRVAGARERRTSLLYAMSRELAGTRGSDNMARVAVRHVAEVFDAAAVILTPDAVGRLRYPPGPAVESSFRGADLSIAQWVFDHIQRAGLGTDTLPAAPAVYLPLRGAQRALGVLGVLPTNRRRILLPEQRHLLETFVGQIALAFERAALGEEAAHSRIAAEAESLRNTLLASISHDLRTPLSVITGAASTLARHGVSLDAPTRRSLADTIEAQAREMSNLISNVLDLMRLESGRLELRRDAHTVEDLVGAALQRLEGRLEQHRVDIDLPSDLPSVWVDPALATQVLTNLVENAAKYTPPGTRIHITSAADGPRVRIVVEDDGPGLPPGDPQSLFQKFQRGRPESAVVGAGLGLAICRAIVHGHGGEITAATGSRGGARFEFTLPMADSAP
ncbi:MAG TPA: sensor histidine kinase KdpD [Steroidobacteraceae bacterium]